MNTRLDKLTVSYRQPWVLLGIWVLGMGGHWLFASSPNSSALQNGRNLTVGDPIYASSGEYVFAVPLFDLGGPLPIQCALTFQPRRSEFGRLYYRMLYSEGFEHTWLRLANPEPGYCSVEYVQGTDKVPFQATPGSNDWQVAMNSSVRYQLQETGGSTNSGYFYFLHPTQQRVYIFDKSSSSDPRPPVWVIDRNYNRLACATNTWGQLGRVSDEFGRWLEWRAGTNAGQQLITSIVDHVGRRVDLGYTNILKRTYTRTNGSIVTVPENKWLLSSVTLPDGNTHEFTWEFAPNPSSWAAEGSGLWGLKQHRLPRGNTPTVQSNLCLGIQNPVIPVGLCARAVEQTDAYGNKTTLSYSNILYNGYDSHVRTTETRPDGSVVVYEHNSRDSFTVPEMGPPTRIVDPTGQTMTCMNDNQENPTIVTNRLGDTTKVQYASDYWWNGERVRGSGLPLEITNALGAVLRLSYTNRNQSFTNPANGEVVTFTLFALARLEYPDRSYESFDYDERGNLLRYANRARQVWSYTYNPRGQVLSAANPRGGTNTFTYGDNALLLTMTDPETGATRFGYDALFRLNAITNADGSVQQSAYDPLDRMTNWIDELGRETRLEYDANGNLLRATDPAGQSAQYAYDLMDRLTNMTSRAGYRWDFAYDVRERLAAITDPAGMKLTRMFDVRGWLTNAVYAGQTWRTEYDAEGIPQTHFSPLGHVTRYATDKLGRTTAITNALGQVTWFTRDTQGRLLAFTNAAGQVTQYRYNQAGALTNVVLPDGSATYYQRNSVGQIEQITDLNGKQWRFAYSPMGRLQTATDPNDRIWQCAYDSRGRVAQVTTPDGSTATNLYDAAGQLTRRDYADGSHLDYAYDVLGRMTNASGVALQYDADGYLTNSIQEGVPFSARYDNQGRLVELAYNNGALRVLYTYDPVTGKLSGVSDTLGNGSVQLAYDADMRLTDVNRGNGKNLALTWDAASQLVRMQDGGMVDLQHQFDAAGRMTNLDYTLPLDPADHLPSGDETAAFDHASQIQSNGYASDALGRLIQGRGMTFQWDAASRLVAIDGVHLAYNGLGNLVTRTENGKTTRFFYHHAIVMTPIVAERDETTGQILRYYVWSPGGSLLYYIDVAAGNRVFYYHFDHAGSTVALTDTAGTVTDAYAYDPYGRLLKHTGTSVQPFTFVGRYGIRQEGTHGLYHMRARYYDAVTARFLSRDPIWPWLVDVQQLNPYQYAANDPVMGIDPLGEGVYNDLWKHDRSNKAWAQLNPTNIPPRRHSHSATVVDSKMYIFFGPDGQGKVLSDAAAQKMLCPATTYGHSFWVFGGESEGAVNLMDSGTFNPSTQTWVWKMQANAPGDVAWIRGLLDGTTTVDYLSSGLFQNDPIENHVGSTEAFRKFGVPGLGDIGMPPGILWKTIDAGDKQDGIGSRFFLINNAE